MSVCSYTANFLQCSFVFSVVVAHARGFNLKLFLLCVPGFSKHAAAKIFVDFAILVFWIFMFFCFTLYFIFLFYLYLFLYFVDFCVANSVHWQLANLFELLVYPRRFSQLRIVDFFSILLFAFCAASLLLLFFFLMIFASFLRLYKNILIKIHFWAFAYERELRCFNCSAVVVMFLFCCACGKNCCDLLIWAHCWLQMSVVVTHTLLFLCFYFAFAKLDFCLLFLNIIFWVFFWSECDTGEYSFTAFCVYFYKSVQSFDAKKCSTQNGAKKRKIYIQIYKIYILF